MPSATSPVTLQPVTAETVRAIVALDVSPRQRTYVASNAVSIAEAHFNPGAWFRAIYADELPVGFVMLFDPTVPGAISRGPLERTDIGLWRLMIDCRYQRRGFGRSGLDLVRTHILGLRKFHRMLSSYVPGADGPEDFYLSYGFIETGGRRNNGKEIEIALTL